MNSVWDSCWEQIGSLIKEGDLETAMDCAEFLFWVDPRMDLWLPSPIAVSVLASLKGPLIQRFRKKWGIEQ